ncbi:MULTISPECIES: aspartate kinase [unclassified Bacillus (in: firmicutes)]|uniref:aspartate kinase n=1 Tax=unclassified Bacillus (in: firmicutes) TaxID=185979 RepID=UPI00080AF6F7|nr:MULTISPECIES: aspartate kinase [unclassified Bacillus (in: firmicutes)]OCA89850.1 aspartate kinase [Bacillus sp. FJAT-27986]
MKVVKFGGTSLASGEQLNKVFEIVVSDPQRKIVVVSAPGKRFSSDTKVTDLLIACGESWLNGACDQYLFDMVIDRYRLIAEDLSISGSVVERIRADLMEILNGDLSDKGQFMDAVKASGEDNNAKLVAAFFQARGVEAEYMNPHEAGLIVSDEPGNAQVLAESYANLYHLRNKKGIVIFPGFFGYTTDGKVMTFPRSGSDITGAILANAVKADLYENYTDVDAVFSVNPTIINKPKEISVLTYREMRELSYAGFSVLHDEALIPAFKAGIPVNIKNTNNPLSPGTMIVNKKELTNGPVVGIASDNDFCSIYVSKYLMNREIGFGRKLLQILEDLKLSYEHVPSGIDDLTVILRQNQMDSELEEIIRNRIIEELEADEVKIEHNLSLIMIVGEGMRSNVGTVARASKALANAGINIEMINQGSSEVSMMFGVKELQENRAVAALYNEFFTSVSV